MKTLKIGFVGVGFMGQMAHLRNYVDLEGCDVTAIAELCGDVREQVARRYAIPNAYETAAEMMERERLDGVVASQPFNRHGIIVPELMRYGVPVFTEKPLAASIQTGECIVEAVDRSGTFLMVGYHKRSDPAIEWAVAEIKRLKATKELGDMTYIRVLMPNGDWIANGGIGVIRNVGDAPTLDVDPPDPDMDAEAYQRYGAFVNFYIHQVNLIRHLLDEAYHVTYADPNGVLLAGTSASGVTCAIEMAPYSTSIAWQEEVLVCFKRGWLKIALPAPLAVNRPGKVQVFHDPGDGATPRWQEPQMPYEHAMRRQAKNFLAAIRGDIPPRCSAAEALEDLHLALAYRRMMSA